MTFAETYETARQFLFARQTAYRSTFLNPVGEKVLVDLAKFCRAHDSTFNPDPHIAARLDGRREVWLRVVGHLNLSQDQLWELYNGKK